MQITKRLMQGIFTYGNLLDTSAVIVRVLSAPEFREMLVIGQQRDHRAKYWQTLQAIIDNIKKYLTVILQTKGSRTTIDARAYRTVLAACSGKNLTKLRSIHATGTILVYYVYVRNMLLRMLSVTTCMLFRVFTTAM